MEFDAWRPPDASSVQLADRNPVIVLFSPGGQISQVYFHGNPNPPEGSVHLLIGRNETIVIQDAANPQASNPKYFNPSDYGNLQAHGQLVVHRRPSTWHGDDR